MIYIQSNTLKSVYWKRDYQYFSAKSPKKEVSWIKAQNPNKLSIPAAFQSWDYHVMMTVLRHSKVAYHEIPFGRKQITLSLGQIWLSDQNRCTPEKNGTLHAHGIGTKMFRNENRFVSCVHIEALLAQSDLFGRSPIYTHVHGLYINYWFSLFTCILLSLCQ